MSATVGHKRGHARLILMTAVTFALLGVVAAAIMPRREDPAFPARFGALTIIFPGASAERVERLLVDTVEEQLEQVDVIEHVDSVARAGAAIFTLELRGDIYDTDAAWNRVRLKIDQVERDLPQGAQEPFLHDSVVQQESILLAISGSPDPLVLRDGARRLRRALLRIDGVARITDIGDPGAQVTIELDEAPMRRMGLNQGQIAAQLQTRNLPIPAGDLRIGSLHAQLSPRTDFESLEDIRRVPITLPSGVTVPLAEFARVRLGPEEPALDYMRHNLRAAVGLGVVPQDDVNLVHFGQDVREVLSQMEGELAPLNVEVVSFQPDYVEARLAGLGSSLLLSMLIVALVLLIFMGWRAASVVTAVVPLIALATLGIYWVGGGILQQISIAACVIALGMLVDNAIVVVESIESHVNAGRRSIEAARMTVKELWLPLIIATGTTVAAFVPLLISGGATADFMRSIPQVIIIALLLSLAAALLVAPIGCAWLIRPRKSSFDPLGRIGKAISKIGVHHHKKVLVGALLVMGGVGGAAPFVEQQFFPTSDRNQFIVRLYLREGTDLDVTAETAQRIERLVAEQPGISSIATYIGRGVPRFYYNVAAEPRVPHTSDILVTTSAGTDLGALAADLRILVADALPGVDTSILELEQGPAVIAPIELRLFGEDQAATAEASDRLVSLLTQIPGTVNVRSDLDMGAPALDVRVSDAAAGPLGVSRSDVARALLGQTRGLTLGEFRAGADTATPIVLRSADGQGTAVSELESLGIWSERGSVPLGRVATYDIDWRPAVRRHRDGRRMTRVTAQLAPGVPFSQVLQALDVALIEEPLPEGVDMSKGGAAAALAAANGAMLVNLPLGLILIMAFLMWEFRSFRRVGIVLVTVPLGAAGIVPGMLLSGQPMGFMSMLGVIALIGVVVNNAIVLLDLVERERESGHSIAEALEVSVRARTKPILLTTLTTVGGLLPLAFSSSTMWPPLASAMISGLSASTFLTLFVVPALYRLLFRDSPSALPLAPPPSVPPPFTKSPFPTGDLANIPTRIDSV